MDFASGPDERPCRFIVACDERLDMGYKFGNALERGAVQRLAREDREPDFDLVEPRGVRRREVEMHVFVALEPHVAPGLVGGEIIQNDMDFLVRIGGDDLVHEVKELDATAALVMFADDLATLEIERREKRRRSMPFVIVRLTHQGTSVRQLQITLRAPPRLDLWFFLHGEHDGVLGWRHVEP